MATYGVAVIAPNPNSVSGVVHFIDEGKMLHIDYDLQGLSDGEHGFHIHEYGDLTDECNSACSHFNPNRMHPILHKIKAHNGVDYAAKRNTPVKASGDGVISFIGRQSGYGRTIEIKHGGNIKTLYAHLERFNSKLKVGSKVKQGEIIAYVGDSGQATGPHLHFEFWQGQVRTDPVKVKLPSAQPVNKGQIEEFRNLLNSSLKKLNEYNSIKDE